MSSKRILIIICILLSSSPIFSKDKNKHEKSMVSSEIVLLEPDRLPEKARKGRMPVHIVEIRGKKGKNIQFDYKEGIDVSHYQGFIDWESMIKSEKLSYAYLKATEGASLVDDTYARNLAEAKRVGLMVGSYHFYSPNISWRLQLQNMISNIKPSDQDLVPIIDIETRGKVSDEQFINDLTAFVAEVAKVYGSKPLLYTFHNFYNRHLTGFFSDYHWMIARYRPDEPTLNDGKDFIIWQYTAKGKVTGIKGNVDRSKIMQGFSLSQLLL